LPKCSGIERTTVRRRGRRSGILAGEIVASGGEALVKMGVEGLRWFKDVMNLQPRFCWMIDVCGLHEQMPQIVQGLGLEAFGLLPQQSDEVACSVG
jgi:hypothetical protein